MVPENEHSRDHRRSHSHRRDRDPDRLFLITITITITSIVTSMATAKRMSIRKPLGVLQSTSFTGGIEFFSPKGVTDKYSGFRLGEFRFGMS